MKHIALTLVALSIGIVTSLALIEASREAYADPAIALKQAVTIEPMAGSATPAVTVNAGSGATVMVAPPSSALPNPAEHPLQAWDDAKAARKTSWPLAVFAVLVMLGKALAYGRDKLKGMPLLGAAAAWLSVGKRAMLVAGFGTIAAAGYDVLVAGGSLIAALTAGAVAIAGSLHSTTRNATT